MLSSLIAAGANLLGNIFQSSQNKSAQEAYNQQQMQIAQQNIAAQKEFAQQGISWKVQDAKNAGLHPLAALGASTSSFSPVSVGGSAPQSNIDFGSFGQDLGRAAKAMMGEEAREAADARRARQLQLEKGSLENDLLRTEIVSKLRREASQVGPAMPVSGVPLPRPGPARMPSGEAVREEDLKQTIEDVPSPESGRPYGFQMPYNRMFGSAQSFEDRYGDSELAQTLKFLVNTGADLSQLAWNSWKNPRTGAAARRRRASRPWGE